MMSWNTVSRMGILALSCKYIVELCYEGDLIDDAMVLFGTFFNPVYITSVFVGAGDLGLIHRHHIAVII